MTEAQRKAQLVARGLCRQCGARRGKCPSKSRCAKCVEKNRRQQRRAAKGQAYQPGRPGRPPIF
jgi:hypothetical protein